MQKPKIDLSFKSAGVSHFLQDMAVRKSAEIKREIRYVSAPYEDERKARTFYTGSNLATIYVHSNVKPEEHDQIIAHELEHMTLTGLLSGMSGERLAHARGMRSMRKAGLKPDRSIIHDALKSYEESVLNIVNNLLEDSNPELHLLKRVMS